MNVQLYDKIAVTVAIAMAHKGTNDRHNGRVVEKVTRDILEAVREELPPLIDVEEKWEMGPEDSGVHVTLKGDDVHDGRQLTYLSKFATDQGYNSAIVKIHNDLYVPVEDGIIGK